MYLLHNKSIIECHTNNDKTTHQKEIDRIHDKLYKMIDYNCMIITLEGHIPIDDEYANPIVDTSMNQLFDVIYANQYEGLDYACYNDVLVAMFYEGFNDIAYTKTQIIVLPYVFDENNNKIIMTIGNMFSTPYERIKNKYVNI